MNQPKIIKEFKTQVNITSKKSKNLIELFTQLATQGFTRLELMIIDSTIKNIPLETLYITLLLSQNKYYNTLQNLTTKIKSFKNQ